ncbi:MAG: 4-(cytidine 5'-diphospho)-2-C-methyl-D-erythritol kinase [Clostridia bacterium]|nr:4-(cytidine 5'-diphospho)-2-C-methyl-D-erythritol kinase [Clostridia bacterium]
MESITLKAYGKVNLALNVGKTRPDGYHDVAMILQSIDLYDEITVEKSDAFSLKITSGDLPEDDRNLAMRAAKLMAKTYQLTPVAILLTKHIPIAAGLGGGSTDAAGVIKAMNELFGLGLTLEELCWVGEQIGSDVPFLIAGGCCLASGRGEILKPIPDVKGLPMVLVKPEFGILTPWSYKAFSPENNPRSDLEAFVRLLEEMSAAAGDGADPTANAPVTEKRLEKVRKMASLMKNQLAKAALEAYPVLGEILEKLEEQGALATMMTGSGPTLFGIFESEESADKAAEVLKKELPIHYCTLRTKSI